MCSLTWSSTTYRLVAVMIGLTPTLLLVGCGTKTTTHQVASGDSNTSDEAPIAVAVDEPAERVPVDAARVASKPVDQIAGRVDEAVKADQVELATGKKIRVATFNVSLFRQRAGQLMEDLESGNDNDAHRLAHIIQIVRPDVLLLNEFDYDSDNRALEAFLKKYLEIGHNEVAPIEYPYYYTNAVNTGEPSGVDLDNDGTNDGWNDCFGFGRYPGQYGMAVVSRFPIDKEATRTFQRLLWKDMKHANLPVDPKTGESFYAAEAINVFRISSKSHWDVVIDVEGIPLHFVVSHPTPPVFDGPEDRNGKRNHDEIRLLADYISNDPHNYIVDDQGRAGGLAAGSHFVIAGDLNADPNDGDSFGHAARQLTEHPLVQTEPIPTSEGAIVQSREGKNADHLGDARNDTADFDDRRTGNLRADYVLPSKTLKVLDAKIFWPVPGDREYGLVTVTDHRMVWIDVEVN